MVNMTSNPKIDVPFWRVNFEGMSDQNIADVLNHILENLLNREGELIFYNPKTEKVYVHYGFVLH